jgi:hypothetical protein
MSRQKKAAEKKESESTQDRVVQVDDLLTFRQFSKKSADDPIDVSFFFRMYDSVPTKSYCSTLRTLAGQQALLKFGKTSSPTSVAYPNLQVGLMSLIFWVLILMTARLFGPYICGSICQDARI